MHWTLILCIAVVALAVVFFIAAALPLLLARYLSLKQTSISNSADNRSNTSAAFQRQLQQLFQLHDSGLDQAHVDSLPIFSYKEVVGGSTEPFDCAVCLCEFLEEDKLRLLPMCGHAFHVDCIDAWLLSNATCPLCRGVILSPPENHVGGDFDDSKEAEDTAGTANAGFLGVIRGSQADYSSSSAISEQRVFSVRLGKFKRIADCGRREDEQLGDGGHLDARRCYSMGSFQYVVADMDLQVAAERLQPSKGLLGNVTIDDGDGIGKKINSGATKGESFSISKIWLWSKKGHPSSSLDLP